MQVLCFLLFVLTSLLCRPLQLPHKKRRPSLFVSQADSRPSQRSRTLAAELVAPVAALPLALGLQPAASSRASSHASPADPAAPVPAAVAGMLRRVRLLPDAPLLSLAREQRRFESVARVGDLIIVADPVNLAPLVEEHKSRKSGGGFSARPKEPPPGLL